jgi:hypothetical protein
VSHLVGHPADFRDPRLELRDFYLFAGRPGSTVMLMTLSRHPAEGPLFREDVSYSFHFDAQGDGHPDVSFTVRFETAFSPGSHPAGQTMAVYRSLPGDTDSDTHDVLMVRGATSGVLSATNGVTAFAGAVRDPATQDASDLAEFGDALVRGDVRPETVAHAGKAVTSPIAAVALEVSNEVVGRGRVRSWATLSLREQGAERQITRRGLPLIHLFLGDDQTRVAYDRTPQSASNRAVLRRIADVVRRITTLAETAADPDHYADRVVDRLGCLALPYVIGSPGAFDFAGFDGRSPRDDVAGVMLSILTNSPLGNGVAPKPHRLINGFPYLEPLGTL